MTRRFIVPSVAVLAAFAASTANAQTVVSRSVTTQPVETTVTQTSSGTIVTRRPIDGAVAPQVAAPVAPIVQTGPAIVESDPGSIDSVTTREVVERAEATRVMRPRVTTRQVSSTRAVAPARAKRTVTTTRQISSRRVAPRAHVALNPRERHIVYQTIVERAVMPTQQVVVAPPAVVAQPPLIQSEVALRPAVVARPPIVAADDEYVRPIEPIYTAGNVLPRNVPLYAMPENVSLSVPAARPYSYAYLGGRAYLVDPATNMVVEDVTE